ncbi:MAG: hypothetical protein J1E35_06895 [Lachnospiraceae bacterium]|nr:hypothetical protein [Lachnospiraceae bacterium]
MRQKKKCEYGYVKSQKQRMILGALLMVFIGVAVFVLGLVLNKFEKANIFTIVAVLFVLPMARYLTTWIILLPFHTPESAFYEKVKEQMPEGAVLFSDYVFTSGERVMGLSFFVLTDNEYIGLAARKKEKLANIREYLTGALKKRAIPGKVVLCGEPEEFLAKLKKVQKVTKSKEDRQELLDFLRSLAV